MGRLLPVLAGAGLVLLTVGGCGGKESTTANSATTAGTDTPPLPSVQRQTAPDPRLTAASRFRNVRPGVQYVGDAKCASCHQALSDSYHRHPMGRSAAVPGATTGPEQLGAAGRLPVEVPGYRLNVTAADGRVEHVVTATAPAAAGLPPYRTTVAVAIGSGTRGRSYLSCEGGAVWQSPLSWYAEGNRWDVSPGFDVSHSARREINPDCLFCHVNRVEPVPGAVNRYAEPLLGVQPAIGCERCHGPGQLHVAEQADNPHPAGGIDDSIVNPRHLSPELRQDICRQCHLLSEARFTALGREAFEFRPGLPLDDFIRVYVRHPAVAASGKSVGQFEQIETSKCHTASGGRLTCTSCHDPHLSPEPVAKPAFYRSKCQACHTPPSGKDCTAPAAERAAAADSCVSCHMPRGDSKSIVHAPVTDHRLLRRPAITPARSDRLPDGATVVVPYRPRNDPDAARDLGLGLATAADSLSDPTLRLLASRQAFERLNPLAGQRPADDQVWRALVGLSHTSDRATLRLAAARSAARVEPAAEASLAVLASAAVLAGQPAESIPVAERLLTINPTALNYRTELVKAAILKADWSRVENECQKALAVYPFDGQTRLFLTAALAKLGRGPEATREMATALALYADPRARADAERWLAGQLR